MALLLILFAFLGFLFSAIGNGSTGISSPSTSRSCTTVVTSVNGKTVRRDSCRSDSGGSTTVHSRAVVRCSARMTADGQTSTRCSPPANP
jgi:hypothetical protein